MDIDKIIDIVRTLKEEGGPTVSMGAGQIAGSVEASNYDPNFTPPVRKKPWNKGKKYMKGPGRKTWMV